MKRKKLFRLALTIGIFSALRFIRSKVDEKFIKPQRNLTTILTTTPTSKTIFDFFYDFDDDFFQQTSFSKNLKSNSTKIIATDISIKLKSSMRSCYPLKLEGEVTITCFKKSKQNIFKSERKVLDEKLEIPETSWLTSYAKLFENATFTPDCDDFKRGFKNKGPENKKILVSDIFPFFLNLIKRFNKSNLLFNIVE